jgi:hypothetical protein
MKVIAISSDQLIELLITGKTIYRDGDDIEIKVMPYPNPVFPIGRGR